MHRSLRNINISVCKPFNFFSFVLPTHKDLWFLDLDESSLPLPADAVHINVENFFESRWWKQSKHTRKSSWEFSHLLITDWNFLSPERSRFKADQMFINLTLKYEFLPSKLTIIFKTFSLKRNFSNVLKLWRMNKVEWESIFQQTESNRYSACG